MGSGPCVPVRKLLLLAVGAGLRGGQYSWSPPTWSTGGHNRAMDLLERVEAHIRRHELIPAGGEVTCLVSGGADSTCLWHVAARARLPRLRAARRTTACAATSRRRTRASAATCSAPRWSTAAPAATEAELRDIRYSFATDRLRATGHTASDQVETVLYRLVSSGAPGGIKPQPRGRRRPPAARPSGARRRRRTAARAASPYRTRLVEPGHEARPDPRRDPAAAPPARPARRARTCCALAESRPRPARGTLDELLELDRRLEARPTSAAASGPCASTTASGSSGGRLGEVRWGPWTIEPTSRASRCAGGGPATGSRAAARSAGRVHGREGAALASARPGRSSCAATRLSRSPGSSRPTGVRALSVTSRLSSSAASARCSSTRTRCARASPSSATRSPTDYAGRDLLLVGVLKGAVFFMADLMRQLTVPCEVDFMAISSYGARPTPRASSGSSRTSTSTSRAATCSSSRTSSTPGLTLSYLMRNLESREPASLEICALLTKPDAPRDRRARALGRLRDPEPVRHRLRARLRRAVPEPAATSAY